MRSRLGRDEPGCGGMVYECGRMGACVPPSVSRASELLDRFIAWPLQRTWISRPASYVYCTYKLSTKIALSISHCER